MAPRAALGRLASNQNAIREEIMLRDATVTRNSIDAGRSDVTSRDPDGERRAPRRHDRHRAPPCGGGTLRSNMDPCSGSEHLAAPISALWPPLDRAAELLALADWAPDDVASFRLACWSFAGQLS